MCRKISNFVPILHYKTKEKNMEKEIIIQRLSYIKYLYLKGEEQSRQAEVVAGFSILAFHDATEMLLMLIYEHLDCGNDKNYKTIDDYLGNIQGIKMKESIKALNKCRISMKHQGQFPSKADIEKHRVNTFSILQENTDALLGFDFCSVSLIDLVSFVECRNFLKTAQEKRDGGKIYESVIESRKAFDSMLSDFESSKNYRFNSLFNIGRKPGFSYKNFVRETTKASTKRNSADDIEKNYVWFEDIDKSVKELRNAVKIISLGIDYKQFVLFNAITPNVMRMGNGDDIIPEKEEGFCKRVHTSQDLCDFCINFVIDCAIKIQDSNYDTSRYLKFTN